jgi:hypothetical protein
MKLHEYLRDHAKFTGGDTLRRAYHFEGSADFVIRLQSDTEHHWEVWISVANDGEVTVVGSQ